MELTRQQRADLQSGKAVLVEGIKGYDGKTISQYVKANFNQGVWTSTTRILTASVMPRSAMWWPTASDRNRETASQKVRALPDNRLLKNEC